MQFSVGVEYALHSLFYLVDVPKPVGIRQIAELHGITESYLSKVFARLRKAGVVRSVPGVRGGYELARPAEDVSFWDIVEAVEGPSPFFLCAELRRKNRFVTDPSAYTPACPCLIKVVMQQAEDQYRDSLRAKSLRWLHDQVRRDFPEPRKQAISEWVQSL